ncbi:MAG: hypothetical protein R3C99_25070 [Pirellulaceae bacterium]|nr:hypothetical protein [Planctomycetales bacterium]MCA9204799.1 hypothetical protein [Planctomycetales bacterium]
MPMLLRCPACQTQFTVQDEAAGTTMRCQCGAIIRVPGAAAPVPAQVVGNAAPAASANPFADAAHGGNPYAAPQAHQQPAPMQPMYTPPQGMVGVWRYGTTLVMHKDAKLPDVCVKSNEPAHGRTLKRKLHWHHPAIGLALLASPLIYIILAAVLTKRATIHIGLSDPYFKRRRLMIAAGWLISLGSLAMFILSIALVDRFDAAPFLIFLGVIGIFVGLIVGTVGSRMIRPVKITDTHVHVKGCHAEFLNRFPLWTFG